MLVAVPAYKDSFAKVTRCLQPNQANLINMSIGKVQQRGNHPRTQAQKGGEECNYPIRTTMASRCIPSDACS
eukprot:492000-Pelagomonas_calceolata.AAC.1